MNEKNQTEQKRREQNNGAEQQSIRARFESAQ